MGVPSGERHVAVNKAHPHEERRTIIEEIDIVDNSHAAFCANNPPTGSWERKTRSGGAPARPRKRLRRKDIS